MSSLISYCSLLTAHMIAFPAMGTITCIDDILFFIYIFSRYSINHRTFQPLIILVTMFWCELHFNGDIGIGISLQYKYMLHRFHYLAPNAMHASTIIVFIAPFVLHKLVTWLTHNATRTRIRDSIRELNLFGVCVCTQVAYLLS